MKLLKRKNKTLFLVLGISLLSTLLLSFFSSSTSPLFPVYYSDYNNNFASIGLFIGKSWSQGTIPYKDLYVLNGPLYYFIQMLGWILANRTGIFLLQILFMSIGIYSLFRVITLLANNTWAWISVILTLLFMMGTLNGGNTPEEYCFSLNSSALYIVLKIKSTPDKEKRKLEIYRILFGIIAGSSIIIQATSNGIIYALIFYLLWNYLFYKKNKISCLQIIIGILLPIGLFFLYFISQNSLSEMINGTFTQLLYSLWTDAFIKTLLIHKIVKSLPAIFLLIFSIIFLKNDKENYVMFAIIGIALLFFAVLGQGYWQQYTSMAIPIILTGVILKNNLHFKNQKITLTLLIFITIGLVFIPIKNYISFITNDELNVYQDLIAEIKENQKYYDEHTLFLVDVPSFVYLETNSTPSYYYFSAQSEYNKTNPLIQPYVNDYVLNTCKDNKIIIQSSSGTYMYIGNYVLTHNYTYGRNMLYIYEYQNQSSEHIHK